MNHGADRLKAIGEAHELPFAFFTEIPIYFQKVVESDFIGFPILIPPPCAPAHYAPAVLGEIGDMHYAPNGIPA